ncbi:hypothetical protein MLD38_012714 [Melastoma candidum]|uniref:Uncharacterized protein n=1 Tax=Melastoma candidum TaxID=119954 RepID=A0ACB9R6U4_9MYRT|nr:hypothetical protein MLD38_012714 [Melastoma candidum]
MPSSKSLSSIFRSVIEASSSAAASRPPQTSASLSGVLGRLRSSADPASGSSPSSSGNPSNKNSETRPSGEEERTLNPVNSTLNIPWLERLPMSLDGVPEKRKLVSRLRKEKWTFKDTQGRRFSDIINMCATKVGAEATLEVFSRMGRETGVKEYNALIGFCIDKARSTDDMEVASEEISKAFRLFEAMKEQGFQVAEGTYGPVFSCLIDMCMVKEFHYVAGLIKEYHQNSASRICYYEMLLYLRIDDDEKIQNLCEQALHHAEDGNYDFLGNCILALCERDRMELFQLLESVDIRKIQSVECVRRIFGSLGRLQMYSLAEKFLLELSTSGDGPDNVSNFISSFAASLPNLVIEDVISKYKALHNMLDIKPSSSSYNNLVTCCCTALQVHKALDLVNEMCESGVPVSMETIHSVVQACDDNYDYYLVLRIYSMILQHDLKTNVETFKRMINLAVKMKDFGAAYNMLGSLKKFKLSPTAGMYNAIMAGYFREKNIKRGLKVVHEMKLAGVYPDSQTYSYLINICSSEQDIVKYYEELKLSGVFATKQVFMALINAYASCGEFEKAKRILQEKEIPSKNLNEINSVLVSALAVHNQMSDALDVYEDIKRNGGNIEAKAVIGLIEHFPPDGDIKTLYLLIEETIDSNYWIHGCQKAVVWCVREKHLSGAVDILKRLKDHTGDNEFSFEAAILDVFCLIAESDATYLEIGFDLLKAIKDDFGVLPPRKAAGLPYNVLTYLRMYQALLASGDHKSARELLKKIPRDDAHVCLVINKCKEVYPSVVPATKTTDSVLSVTRQLWRTQTGISLENRPGVEPPGYITKLYSHRLTENTCAILCDCFIIRGSLILEQHGLKPTSPMASGKEASKWWNFSSSLLFSSLVVLCSKHQIKLMGIF